MGAVYLYEGTQDIGFSAKQVSQKLIANEAVIISLLSTILFTLSKHKKPSMNQHYWKKSAFNCPSVFVPYMFI